MAKFKVCKISESGKSAMVTVKMNGRSSKVTNAYVGLLEEEIGKVAVGDSIEIEEGFKLENRFDSETGELMCFSDGTPMHFLEW